MVIYDSGSFTHGLLWGTFAVNRNSETLLANIKEGIFEQLPDHGNKSHDYHPAPRDYCPEYFNLAKTGRAKKSPVVLHSNEVFARYLDNTKGEIVYGGGMNQEKKFIEPTLVAGVDGADSLMSEYVDMFICYKPLLTDGRDSA